MRLLFALLGLSLIIGAIWMDGTVAAFINLPSIAVVVGGTMFFTLASHSVQNVVEALRISLNNDPCSAEGILKHIAVMSTMRNLALYTGMTGMFIGLITMLANLEDPSTIGPAMAVALLSSLYGIILAEIIIGPLVNRMVVKGAHDLNDDPPPPHIEQDNSSRGQPQTNRTILFSILGIAVLVGVMSSLANIFRYIDAPSILLVVGGILTFTLANHSPTDLWGAIKNGIKPKATGKNRAIKDQTILSTSKLLALGLGAMGFFIGCVKILQNLDNLSTLGPAMAVTLLTPFYGSVLAILVWGPIIQTTTAVANPSRSVVLQPAQGNGWLLTALILGTSFCFMTLLAALSTTP